MECGKEEYVGLLGRFWGHEKCATQERVLREEKSAYDICEGEGMHACKEEKEA